jgi:hypothetical protein
VADTINAFTPMTDALVGSIEVNPRAGNTTYYATHCVSPCLAIDGAEAEYVSCVRSGRIGSELAATWGSPVVVESAHIWFRNSDRAAYRFLFATPRQYRESFEVFGTLRSVKWPLTEGTGLVVHTAKMRLVETTDISRAPDYAHLPPEPVRHFTTKTCLDLPEYKHRGADPDRTHSHLIADRGSLEGHGGSHPHLLHEFVSALIEDRDPLRVQTHDFVPCS